MNIFIPNGGLRISSTRRCRENYARPQSGMVKGSLSELNTGNMVLGIHTELDGSRIAQYHVNIIDLLDQVFLTNCLNLVTPEQERFLSRFFNQAGNVDKLVNENAEDIYLGMDEVMQQFDSFLGNYYGVDDGRYAR